MKVAPGEVEKLREHYRNSFRDFVKRAWVYVNNDPELIWSEHLDIVCDHLEHVVKGDIQKLIVDIPPGTSKSRLITILFPCWVWLSAPQTQFLVASHGEDVLHQFGEAILKLVRSPWYGMVSNGLSVPANAAKSNIVNDAGGYWNAVTPRGQITGKHADFLIFDDLVEPVNADKKEIETACQWISGTWLSRVNDLATAKYIGVGQRISETDPYQYCIERGWFSLVLPARYEGGRNWATLENGEQILQDWRETVGENLCAKRLPEDYLNELQKLYPRVYAGQYQQRPAPAGGGIFQPEWLNQQWSAVPGNGTWLLSVDAAFKGTEDSDFVAIQVWTYQRPNFYLVDQIRARLSFTGTLQAIRRALLAYPQTHIKIIEDKANGAAIVDLLGKEIPGLVAVNPDGGKEARANAVSACFAAGNVHLPERFGLDPQTTLAMYKHELEIFGAGKNDDMVDATTQAINWLLKQDTKLAVVSKGMMAAMTGAPPEVLKPKEEQPQMGYNAWRTQQLSRRR